MQSPTRMVTDKIDESNKTSTTTLRMDAGFQFNRLPSELQQMVISQCVNNIVAPAYETTEDEFLENKRQAIEFVTSRTLAQPENKAFERTFNKDLAALVCTFPHSQIAYSIDQADTDVRAECKKLSRCFRAAIAKRLTEFQRTNGPVVPLFMYYAAGIPSRELFGAEQPNPRLLHCNRRLMGYLLVRGNSARIAEDLETPDEAPRGVKRKGDLLVMKDSQGRVEVFKRTKVTDWTRGIKD